MRRWHGITLLLAAAVLAGADAPDTRPGVVHVAAVSFGDGVRTTCFSEAFLAEADRRSTLHVDRRLHEVAAESEQLFTYPMVVMSGSDALAVTPAQQANLRAYLMRGGFLVAGAACADKAWDRDFRAALAEMLPGASLRPLSIDHPIFSTLFRIDRVVTALPTDEPLWGLEVHGRLAVVYSPAGLNDSADLGAECCCCGTNEVRNARQINANALVYAVTR